MIARTAMPTRSGARRVAGGAIWGWFSDMAEPFVVRRGRDGGTAHHRTPMPRSGVNRLTGPRPRPPERSGAEVQLHVVGVVDDERARRARQPGVGHVVDHVHALRGLDLDDALGHLAVVEGVPHQPLVALAPVADGGGERLGV